MVLNVIFPLSLPMEHLSYSYTGSVKVGARVVVPWGKTKTAVGIVASRREPIEGETLREVISVLDSEPLIDEKWIKITQFIAQYHMCRVGDVVKTFIASHILSEEFTPSSRLLKNRNKKATPIYSSRPEPIIKLEKATTLLHQEWWGDMAYLHTAREIVALHGGGTTLVLVPNEYAARKLAAQIEPYAPITLYHPKLTAKCRAGIFVDMATVKKDRIVVGTRSAIGLPLHGLKLIVVVDEHSFAYKSPRSPRYNARDMALMVASAYGAKVLLTSPTPSVESYFNATTLPSWEYIAPEESRNELRSMVLEHGAEFLSKYFKRRAEQEIGVGRQVVVFQNRRGTGTVVCPTCKDTPMCPDCNCALTLHSDKGLLRCHYCGHSHTFNTKCESCGLDTYRTQGRGTQRLEEQLTELFPTARTARLDSDNTSKYDEITREFSGRELDIIVGTQMVINSLDFSGVGIVVVANADNMLSINDFRASEQAYRLLRSLAIICREVDAELIVQTSSHTNKLIGQAITSDAQIFYNEELTERKRSLYPPFSRLIEVEMRSPDSSRLFRVASEIENILRPIFGNSLSPLFQPTIERQAGNHVAKMLLKIDRQKSSATAKERIVRATEKIVRREVRKVEIGFIVDPL